MIDQGLCVYSCLFLGAARCSGTNNDPGCWWTLNMPIIQLKLDWIARRSTISIENETIDTPANPPVTSRLQMIHENQTVIPGISFVSGRKTLRSQLSDGWTAMRWSVKGDIKFLRCIAPRLRRPSRITPHDFRIYAPSSLSYLQLTCIYALVHLVLEGHCRP